MATQSISLTAVIGTLAPQTASADVAPSQRRAPREACRLFSGSGIGIQKCSYGDVPTKVAERNALIAAYGASDEDAGEIQNLAKGANQRGWWQSYKGAVPRWFQRYVGLESAAAEIRTYEVELIPGFLQAESYTKALITSSNPEMPQSEVDGRLKVRSERHNRLLYEGVRLVAVMSEAAIRRMVGGHAVMTEQLKLLLEVQQQAQAEVQIIPYTAGAHPATGFPFILLRFPDDIAPSLAYTESLTSAAYHDRQADVDTYTLTFDRMRAVALSPADSADLIQRALTDL